MVDSADPVALGAWWSELLGWRITESSEDEVVVAPPEGTPAAGASPELLFARNPDRKTVKNRLHIDLRPDDQDAEVARALALGARHVDVGQRDVSWVVLVDPEDNEFCILRALSAGGGAVTES